MHNFSIPQRVAGYVWCARVLAPSNVKCGTMYGIALQSLDLLLMRYNDLPQSDTFRFCAHVIIIKNRYWTGRSFLTPEILRPHMLRSFVGVGVMLAMLPLALAPARVLFLVGSGNLFDDCRSVPSEIRATSERGGLDTVHSDNSP